MDYVRQYLTQRYGDAIYTQGLKIQTTIDPTLQAEADATEAKYMAKAPIDRYLDAHHPPGRWPTRRTWPS